MKGIPPAWMIEEILKEEQRRLKDDERPRLHIDSYVPPERPQDDDENTEGAEAIKINLT